VTVGVLWLGFTGYYLASYLDFVGLQYITASLERLILYLNPTLVLLLGWVLYGQRIGRHRAVGMAVSYCGVVLVFGLELTLDGRADAAWGSLLVFLSTISYALYLSYSGELVKRLGALRLAGLATTVACVLCIAQFALLRPLARRRWPAPSAVAVAAQCHPVHRAAGAAGDDGHRAHRPRPGRPDRHGRPHVHHLHGCADAGRAVQHLGHRRAPCWWWRACLCHPHAAPGPRRGSMTRPEGCPFFDSPSPTRRQ
jgi:hypothetical protein